MATNARPSQPLRVVSVGTLFTTTTLTVDNHPNPDRSPVVRAQVVTYSRGGSATTISSILAQFHSFLGTRSSVEPFLVASLADNQEQGRHIIEELKHEGIQTRYCKMWKGYTVPSAWVIQTGDEQRSIINHNSLPDLSHDDFIALLGPILAPENFGSVPSPQPTTPTSPTPSSPRPSYSSGYYSPGLLSPTTFTPAPFDWLHFEGRSVKTTLQNMQGVHSLATERRWRSHVVFSVDLGRRYRQGVEALIPHADVIFVNKHYATDISSSYSSTSGPRSFLLSLTAMAPKHALLVADWGKAGAAVLSVPTRDYFQSSAWSPRRNTRNTSGEGGEERLDETVSVRSSRGFWPDGRSTPSSSGVDSSSDDDYDERETAIPESDDEPEDILDEVGAADAFIAGMIYSLSRHILPGSPYTPFSSTPLSPDPEKLDGRWRLEECLRFATELSGRAGRNGRKESLAAEMRIAGWAVGV